MNSFSATQESLPTIEINPKSNGAAFWRAVTKKKDFFCAVLIFFFFLVDHDQRGTLFVPLSPNKGRKVRPTNCVYEEFIGTSKPLLLQDLDKCLTQDKYEVAKAFLLPWSSQSVLTTNTDHPCHISVKQAGDRTNLTAQTTGFYLQVAAPPAGSDSPDFVTLPSQNQGLASSMSRWQHKPHFTRPLFSLLQGTKLTSSARQTGLHWVQTSPGTHTISVAKASLVPCFCFITDGTQDHWPPF